MKLDRRNVQIRLPLRGIVPPIVTPLVSSDRLDLDGLANLVESMIAGGVSGIFALGTTGEAQALGLPLRLQMVHETCRLVNDRVPVLAGISDTSLRESFRMGEEAIGAGATGLVVAPPFYTPLAQRELLKHIETLLGALQVPIFLYNIPGLTKVRYEPDTVLAAAAMGAAGLKDSSGDMVYFHRVRRRLAEHAGFSLLVGPEELLGEAVLMGAHGGVCGGANFDPQLYVDMFRSAELGDAKRVRELQRRVMAFSDAVYHIGSPESSYIRGLKCALGIRGLCSDLPAPPLEPLDEAEHERMRSWLCHNEAFPAALKAICTEQAPGDRPSL